MGTAAELFEKISDHPTTNANLDYILENMIGFGCAFSWISIC